VLSNRITRRWWAIVLVVWGSAAGPHPAFALGQSAAPARGHLLDVPYLTQTPELCGGAAVSMVLRYWGERDVFPQDFASLVVPGAGGIPTGALTSAVQARGWQGAALEVDEASGPSTIRSHLSQARPLIALIEVAPRTYHFVVVVGATDRDVVVHDPARAPFRVMTWREFDRAWTQGGRWLLLILPPANRGVVTAPTPAPATPDETPTTPCTPLMRRGVELAQAGNLEEAEQALLAGTQLCPTDAGPWRELAGVRFIQSRWSDAETYAAVAVRLAPADAHARQLLATSRYLMGNLVQALDAWTPLGEPLVDTVTVVGDLRTPHPVVVSATRLQPRQLLTADAFVQASRRVRELPVSSNTRLSYEPLDNGRARVDVVMAEADVFPLRLVPLAVITGRAFISDELRLDVAGALRGGERLSLSWRWADARPRAFARLALPAPRGWPGIVVVEAMGERQTYDAGIRQSRRRMSFAWSDWATHWLRWQGSVATDRFDGVRHLSAEGSLDLRLFRDRLAVIAEAGHWWQGDGPGPFSSGGLRLAWRSTADDTRPTFMLSSQAHFVTREAPLALWPGAGHGSGRAPLLRAHPLLNDDVLNGPAFGRQLVQATAEGVWPLWSVMGNRVASATFVDVARAWRPMAQRADAGWLADIGVGVRIRPLGMPGLIRLDVAHGLRGGGIRWSVGSLIDWPH
jgi:hypothetical protein